MNALEQTLNGGAIALDRKLPRAARLVLEMLARLEDGAIVVELPDGQRVRTGRGALVTTLRVHEHVVFDELLARGDIGFGETWMDGAWDCDDLPALLTLLARNRQPLERAIHGHWFRLLAHRALHVARSNTRAGARRNIEAHYDLGNAFYAAWLDRTMSYSAAVFAEAEESLEDAQRRKYRRILDALGAKPGQTILEVGCGWGGFAEVAATEYGCTVLGLTLSPAQLEYARARALRGAYEQSTLFELCDYRDVRGDYDHIVSIEMIEAVGERYWPQYFRQLAARLRPGGRCVIQAITINDERFGRYRRGTDFIQRHIFPGGMLPSPSAFTAQATRAGLAIRDDFAFGADYARTLACWREAFEQALPAVREQGFDARFIRMWRFYLAYCEAGFHSRDLDVHHYVLSHAGPGGA